MLLRILLLGLLASGVEARWQRSVLPTSLAEARGVEPEGVAAADWTRAGVRRLLLPTPPRGLGPRLPPPLQT